MILRLNQTHKVYFFECLFWKIDRADAQQRYNDQIKVNADKIYQTLKKHKFWKIWKQILKHFYPSRKILAGGSCRLFLKITKT